MKDRGRVDMAEEYAIIAQTPKREILIGKPCGTCGHFGAVASAAGFRHCGNPVFSRGWQHAEFREFDCEGHLDGLQGAILDLDRHFRRMAFSFKIENPNDLSCGTVDDPQVDIGRLAPKAPRKPRAKK